MAKKRKVLGIFIESWKNSPFDGIPKPIEKTQERKAIIKILASVSFLSNFPRRLHLCNDVAAATFLQLSMQTPVSGAHPGPRQPSGIFPFRQRTSKPSSLIDSVCELKRSNFPLKAHSPEMMKWGRRLPSSLTMSRICTLQHSCSTVSGNGHVSLRSHRRESTGAPARSRRQVCVSLSGSASLQL